MIWREICIEQGMEDSEEEVEDAMEEEEVVDTSEVEEVSMDQRMARLEYLMLTRVS